MKTERVLSRWGLLMIGSGGPILAGCEGMEVHRTSTPLLQFDPIRLTGTTSSGRPYRLVGEPEPQYALAVFYRFWDAADVRVVTPAEAVALIAQKGNQPFDRTAEEQTRMDQAKLDHLSGHARTHISVLRLDAETAARRAGLSREQLEGLLQADLSRITADEADAAFVRLVSSGHG